ncbi:glycosyltransferase family 2 protein [Arthrobacter sp. H-02-3]|uniref:glycosyltransferase family 2 protein n=1 Tax=Arthrobacter sp. H-02-3 TaxID=2703675 RepID=UPI000DD20C31|nr:glycosyltransferase [Arthrobacter sp. H-02-3]PVZ57065.1 glycosyltransferase family 2 protein [Arthrobacter sp. H-02-3]
MKRIKPVGLVRRPLVSVVIPCYNYARYLPDAVSSVLDQTEVDLELIIVDDASADDSPQIAARFAAADERIRLVRHTRNMGHIATYNDGLSRVSGEYVVLLSADDMLAPGSLARSTALMEARPEVVLAYGYAMEFKDSVPPAPGKRASWSVWSGEDWMRAVCRSGSNVVVNPEAILRRSAMDQLVGYRADMPHAADMDLWLRAASMGHVGRVNGPVQAFYRVHGSNMHLTDYRGLLTDLRARREVFDGLGEGPGGIGRPRVLADKARRALASEALREANQLLDVSGDAQAASELAEFAADTDQGSTRSALWLSYQLRRRRRLSELQRRLSKEAYRWRWSLRWRRWRRFGV